MGCLTLCRKRRASAVFPSHWILPFVLYVTIALPGCGSDDDAVQPRIPEFPRVGEAFRLDLDGNGVIDFVFEYQDLLTDDEPPSAGANQLFLRAMDQNAVQFFEKVGTVPLEDGVSIDESATWEGFGVTLIALRWTRAEGWEQEWSGPWAGVPASSLGLRLQVGGSVHYGWVKVTVDKETGDLFVHDHAYSPSAGDGILSGVHP